MDDDCSKARIKAQAISQGSWMPPTTVDRRQCSRTRPMEVLCLGRERTGTLSLRTALLQLGYYDVYHMASPMIENLADCEMWNDAFDGKFNAESGKQPFTRAQWDALLGHCAATTDQPCATFGEELMRAYPDAKVILTVRDSPEAWHKSICSTVLPMTTALSPPGVRHPGWNPLNHLRRLLAPRMSGHPSSQPFMDKLCDILHADELWGARAASEAYTAHNQHIRDLVRDQGREGQFLEFNVKQGWGLLCAFLGKPVPDAPFPNVNDTASHQVATRAVQRSMAWGYAVNALKLFGPVVLAVGAFWWLKSR